MQITNNRLNSEENNSTEDQVFVEETEDEAPFYVIELTDDNIQQPVELQVTKLQISDDELHIDTEQERERIRTLSKYYVKEEDIYYQIEEKSNEESEINISNDTIINQDIDQILLEYEVFKQNAPSAELLQKIVSICFNNGIKALLSFNFVKNTTKNVDLSMLYGFRICHRTIIDQESLDKCYSYLTKRFKTTLLNLLNIKSSKGLKVDIKPFNDDLGKIFSDPMFDNDSSIGNVCLYKIYISKPKA